MSQTKTPPWERPNDKHKGLDLCMYRARYDLVQSNQALDAAWSELCALQAVAEAAEAWDANSLEAPQLRSAIKEWRAICPK